MPQIRPPLLVAALAAALAGLAPAHAATLVAPPSIKIGPVFEVTPPPGLPPASELPTAQYAVGMYSAILAQANSSYEQPTSPAPALPNCSGYNLNRYSWYWPTVAQSKTWWAAQPGAPAPGTEAYTIGVAISHQQQEGWQLSGGCVYDPQPVCSGTGYTNGYSWGGQFTGWTGSCVYNPEPSCTGTGITSNYSWTGSSWSGGCVYHPEPTCPGSMTPNYSWTGSYWSGSCQEPTQPSCPSGYGGSYTWWGYPYYYWHDGCTAPVQPTSPPSGSGGGGTSGGGGSPVQSYASGYLHYMSGNSHGGGGGLFPQTIEVTIAQFNCALKYGFENSGMYDNLPLASLNASGSNRTNDLSDIARYCGVQ